MAWNMRGFMETKLHQLIHSTPHLSRPVLSYLLQETHLPRNVTPLGTPSSYRVLQHPCPSTSSHEGQLLLLHPAAEVLWHDTTPTTLAVYIHWGMHSLYLMSVHLLPRPAPAVYVSGVLAWILWSPWHCWT